MIRVSLLFSVPSVYSVRTLTEEQYEKESQRSPRPRLSHPVQNRLQQESSSAMPSPPTSSLRLGLNATENALFREG